MTSKALIAMSDVKAFLKFQAGHTADDARLLGLILTATNQIEDWTRRKFTTQAHVEYFSTRKNRTISYDFSGDSDTGLVVGARAQIFALQGFPVIATGFKVSYDPTMEFAATTELEATSYQLDLVRNRMILKFPTLQTYDGLKVEYTGGYAIADNTLSAAIPADLKHACVLQVMELWSRSQPANIGVNEDRAAGATGQSRFTVQSGLLPEVMGLVAKYRRQLAGAG